MAARALPGVGADRRRGRVRRRAHRPRRARAVGLLDRLRPPLRLPARPRRAGRGGDRRRRASSACGSSPRAARWTSASRDGGLPPDELVEDARRRARRHGAARGARRRRRCVQLAVAPCSPFSVTKELMDESAALARRLGLRLHTHLAETVEEEDYCRELYGCTPVEYLDRARLDWPATSGAPTASTSPTRTCATFGRDGVGVAHCPTSNLRLGAGVAPRARPARRGRPRRPRRRRLGVERAQRPLLRGQAGAARRARARRPGGDDGARGAAARHARRRRGARPRRHRLARARQARRRRGLAHGRPRARRRRRSSSPASCSRGPHRVDRLVRRRRGGRPRRAPRQAPTRTRSRAPIGSRREDSRTHDDLDPRARHASAARRPPASASSSTAATSSSAQA